MAETTSDLMSLPPELKYEIASHLDYVSFTSLRLTGREFYNVLSTHPRTSTSPPTEADKSSVLRELRPWKWVPRDWHICWGCRTYAPPASFVRHLRRCYAQVRINSLLRPRSRWRRYHGRRATCPCLGYFNPTVFGMLTYLDPAGRWVVVAHVTDREATTCASSKSVRGGRHPGARRCRRIVISYHGPLYFRSRILMW